MLFRPLATFLTPLERPADIARIQRYVNSTNSAYYKAMRELQKMQAARAEAEQEEEAEAMEKAMIRAMTAAPAPTSFSAPSSPAIGFVSHNTAAPFLAVNNS